MEGKNNLPMTTVMMCLLFGTNFLLFLLFQIIKFNSRPSEDVSKKNQKEKEFSKPFIGTTECFINLTSEVFRTGLIMALTYICEKMWFFEHSTKSYSRDLFLFVLIIFFAYGFYTIKPTHDLALLGREQTEEWKGWMQFIFLLYHYFHAEEVYNSVRVMITCYVWMTGFGNFSFFYIKQDFGWLRVVQMLWRLNFSVLLLMWTHGNTYILYYICPMHTFYFLMVYLAMYIFSSVNTTKWGIRLKLMVLGVIIYIVWDINGGLFDFLFAWLGTDKVIGATNGSVWEYYFRTSLDHWSSFLGMIFALNFPLAEQFFPKAKGWPLYIASFIMGAATIWWLTTCYTQEKLSYNLTHAYYSIIPLTSYIFFRNITPAVRSGVSMSFHDLGKTTLETYLLQHHIWLTSNAKTLLTITPGNPWINFALATILFFTVSKELYRLTMSLRGMVMPDDKTITFNNIIGLVVILSVLYGSALFLDFVSPTALEIILACIGLALVTIVVMNRFAKNLHDNFVYHQWSSRAMLFLASLLAVGIVVQLTLSPSPEQASEQLQSLSATKYIGNTPKCIDSISEGRWVKVKCAEPSPSKANKLAFCQTDQWVWDSPDCPVNKFSSTKLRSLLKGKRVAFIGDSLVRQVYHQFIATMDSTYKQNTSQALKHSDMTYQPSYDKNSSVTFIWAPLVENVLKAYSNSFENGKPTFSLMVSGVSYWDALHVKDVNKYKTTLNSLADTYGSANGLTNIWLLPTSVIDSLLPTAEKQQFMTESIIDTYRIAFKESKAKNMFKSVIDPTKASISRESGSVDGIHYTQEVYQVIAQMIANGFSLHIPSFYSSKGSASAKPYVPKVTGSMSSPFHGAIVLIVSFIMLFLMDAYLGVGYISLLLCGRGYDWDLAYGPLHKKINSGLAAASAPKVKEVELSDRSNETDSLIDKSSDKQNVV